MKVKWVNGVLVAAGLFISGVLIYLTVAGVQLKERRMIKWSSVESPQLAGAKVGRFLFPLIQQNQNLQVIAEGEFARPFFWALQKEALKNNSEARITISTEKTGKGEFVIFVRPLGNTEPVAECANGDMISCAEKSALRKFLKKETKPQQQWITMYRLGENESILFYKQID